MKIEFRLVEKMRRFDAYYVVGYLVVIFQGSSLSMIRNVSNLDASWWYLTNLSAQNLTVSHQLFIGSYGPLGFLDLGMINWSLGLFLSSLWRLLAFTIFYFLLINVIKIKTQKRTNQVLLAVLVTTIVSFFIPPSQLFAFNLFLFLVLLLSQVVRPDVRFYAAIGLLAGINFDLKLLSGLMTAVLGFAILISDQLVWSFNRKELFRKVICSTLSFLFIQVLVFAFFGFSVKSLGFYLKGSYEVLKGYKSMSYEEPGRLWEYFAAATIGLYLLFILHRLRRSIYLTLTFVAFLYLILDYGFVRHDSHVDLTFCFLSFALFTLLGVRKSNLDLVVLTVSVLVFLEASGLNLISLTDTSGRLNRSFELIKLVEPKFKQQLIQGNIDYLKSTYPLNPQALSILGHESVAILPWDQILAVGYGLNLRIPPSPQPITAYTPWLDLQNVNWLRSSLAPRYILESAPKSIDYRNPLWDSPRFQIEIICTYQPVWNDSNWLIMQHRKQAVCDSNNYRFVSKSQGLSSQPMKGSDGIVFASLSQKEGVMNSLFRIIFKPFSHDKISIDGVPTKILWTNSRYLIMSVPKQLNPLGPWKIPHINEIKNGQETVFSYYFVPVSLP